MQWECSLIKLFLVYCSYYEDIKKMPSVSEHDLQTMLREESQVGPIYGALVSVHLELQYHIYRFI